MKRQLIITSLVTVFTICTILILAQNRRDGDVPAEQVNQAIQTFSRLLTPETIKSFGFNSVDELRSLRAGKQFRKHIIGLEDIRKFTPQTQLSSIIKPLDAVEVTLVNPSGEIRSGIEFTMRDGKWQAGSFGLSPDLTRLKNAQRSLTDVQIDTVLWIVIPALQTTFLMKGQGQQASFIILENNERLQFRTGSAVPAAEAIQRLKVIANEYNGLPQ
jgi:hypothetical protein